MKAFFDERNNNNNNNNNNDNNNNNNTDSFTAITIINERDFGIHVQVPESFVFWVTWD